MNENYENIRLLSLQAKINTLVYNRQQDPKCIADALERILDTTPRWKEQDDIIYLSVTSDGTPGPEWIPRLEGNDFCLRDDAKAVLESPDFIPTDGVTTEIAILKGGLFSDDKNRTTQKIYDEADKRNLEKPNIEVACLIRENFSDEDIQAMGLWWIVVFTDLFLLSLYRGDSGRMMHSCHNHHGASWGKQNGFVFVTQTSS
jgi:hypothetical protein